MAGLDAGGPTETEQGLTQPPIVDKKSVSWKENPVDAYINWLEKHLGPEAAKRDSEKIVKLMLKAESKWQIAVMKLYLKSESSRGDAFFDKTREVVVGIAQGLPKYPLFAEQGPDKQAEIQRWCFSTYVGGLLNTARGGHQSDPSIRGIAWSLLAKDARDILAERGQTVDGEWLFKTMGPLMKANTDPKAIGEQLSRFTNGDSEVIHKQSSVVSESK